MFTKDEDIRGVDETCCMLCLWSQRLGSYVVVSFACRATFGTDQRIVVTRDQPDQGVGTEMSFVARRVFCTSP